MFNRKKNRTETIRVPPEIKLQIEEAMKERLNKNLMKQKEFKTSEAFKLISRTPEWNIALEKLKKLPRREDLF